MMILKINTPFVLNLSKDGMAPTNTSTSLARTGPAL